MSLTLKEATIEATRIAYVHSFVYSIMYGTIIVIWGSWKVERSDIGSLFGVAIHLLSFFVFLIVIFYEIFGQKEFESRGIVTIIPESHHQLYTTRPYRRTTSDEAQKLYHRFAIKPCDARIKNSRDECKHFSDGAPQRMPNDKKRSSPLVALRVARKNEIPLSSVPAEAWCIAAVDFICPVSHSR